MIDRRRFITRSARAAAGIALAGPSGLLHAALFDNDAYVSSPPLTFAVPEPDGLPQMVIVKGDSPARMVRKALEAFGGMKRFVSKGDRVALKPNASWDRTPEQGADTHPEIVAAVVELAIEAGAREVIAFDHTIGEPKRCFARSGIGPAVKKVGGKIFYQGDRAFRTVDLGGEAIGKAKIMTPLLEADKFITIPIVKQHGLSKLTATMKNLYGIIGGVRPLLHKRISKTIVDLARFAPPTLVVMDAFSVMTRNGPSGGRPEDLIHPRTIALGTDQVAMDSYAASFIGLSPSDVGHIKLAAEKKLGTMDYKSLRTETLTL